RIESLQSRLEFNERRARALESVVVYKPSEAAANDTVRAPMPEPRPVPEFRPRPEMQPMGQAQAPGSPPAQSGEGPGQRRRRRRRRGRRGGGPPGGSTSMPGSPQNLSSPTADVAAAEPPSDQPTHDTPPEQ